MREFSVAVEGSGVGALCCAHLLRSAGVRVSTDAQKQQNVPVLLLSPQTEKLLGDVFGESFTMPEAVRIMKRIVKWGENAEPIVLPHAGLVVRQSELLTNLWARETSATIDTPRWRILTSRKLDFAQTHYFGGRDAVVATVELHSHAPSDACWIESLREGWLFLLPLGEGKASLISVGAELSESSMISKIVRDVTGENSRFPAAPAVSTPICQDEVLACGTAALRFDPLCGEGAGHAVREAILASAVVRAASKNMPVDELLQLYRSRLLNGFARHLGVCDEFYRSGGQSDWWQWQSQQLREGMVWCAEQIGQSPQLPYRLNGFDLQRLCA